MLIVNLLQLMFQKLEGDAYGFKYWILERYRTVCKNYNLECDPTYMDENYKYSINKDVESEIDIHRWF